MWNTPQGVQLVAQVWLTLTVFQTIASTTRCLNKSKEVRGSRWHSSISSWDCHVFITQNGALFTFLGLQLDIGLLTHFQPRFPRLFAVEFDISISFFPERVNILKRKILKGSDFYTMMCLWILPLASKWRASCWDSAFFETMIQFQKI